MAEQPQEDVEAFRKRMEADRAAAERERLEVETRNLHEQLRREGKITG